MVSIKHILKINNTDTSAEYLQSGLLDEEINTIQNEYPYRLIKLFIIFLIDKKVIVLVAKDKIELLKGTTSSNILTYQNLEDYSILNLNESFLNQFEINITKNGTTASYYEAVIKAKEKVNSFFEANQTKIPIVKLVDYKFGNPVLFILPDKLTDCLNIASFEYPERFLNKTLLSFYESSLLQELSELNRTIISFSGIEKLTEYSWLPVMKLEAQPTLIDYLINNDVRLTSQNVLDFGDRYVLREIINKLESSQSRGLIFLDYYGNIVQYSNETIVAKYEAIPVEEERNTNLLPQDLENVTDYDLPRNSILIFAFNGSYNDCLVSE